ncbi:MAG: TauD/TfdA family dioxygenase [Gammaproteobacteria bacterium]|nr:TauD/TfdA family dioxygenase [Gammaproteobacteria bacterium]
MKKFAHIKVKPVSPNIGAEITGVRLAEPLSADVVDEINGALIRFLVIFFRDQSLTLEQLQRVASQFGKPTPYPFIDGLDGFPEIIEVLKLPGETENFGGVWHSDTTYLESPSMGAMLYAVEVPEAGGDTLFANMYSAYQQLSEGMQDLLVTLSAVNDADKSEIAQSRIHRMSNSQQKNLRAIHPVIRTHPETSKKLLYVNRAHTTRFDRMTRSESEGLLNYLFDIQSRPEHCCRFHWQAGSLAFWDNRACQHYPVNDYQGQKRLMYRISLAGNKPF